MRLILLILIVCTGLSFGCATHTNKPKQPKPAPVVADDGLPPDDSALTKDQIIELRARLAKLQKGMGRDQVLEILNLSSFNVKSYVRTSRQGLIYHIQNHHVLELSFEPGDYDFRLKWAKFDVNEAYPKPGTPHAPPLGPTP